MSEPDADDLDPSGDWDEVDWDEVVDVICVGTSPGVQAYGMICAAAGFDVWTIGLEGGGLDPATRAYLDAMTADLDGLPPWNPGAPIRARSVQITPGRKMKHDWLDPFVGEELRMWSAACHQASSGVLFTAVPDHVLTTMRTEVGGLITAAALPADPVADVARGTLIESVDVGGRIVGALISDDSGRRLVRAEHGLALGVGPVAPAAPAGGNALVGRPAGRFAMLQQLGVLDE